MSKKSKEEAYNDYINQKPACPECGGTLKYVGGLAGWECPDCGLEADVDYNEYLKEYVAVNYGETYEEVYGDEVITKPKYCEICGGPFPDCITGCKVFDD